MAFRSTLFIILVLLIRAQAAQRLEVQSDSPEYHFYFDITVKNRSNTPAVLVQVGIRSKLRYGSFKCLGGATTLLPVAKYIVAFDVSKEETIINAHPPVEIEPGHAARFTLGYVPDAAHACGPWEAHIFGILKFDDGEKLYSTVEQLTDSDVRMHNKLPVNAKDIQEALKDGDPNVRKVGVSRLPDSAIDNASRMHLLEIALRDENRNVRIEAARAAGALGFRDLSPVIITLLQRTNDNSEMIAYSDALGLLKASNATDTLIAAIADLGFENSSRPADALIRLEQADVPKKLRPLLTEHREWAQTGASERQMTHYLAICIVLLRYHDMESLPLFKILLTQPRFSRIADRFIDEVRPLLAVDQRLQDPFLSAFTELVQARGKSGGE
jgi:hypothetical protein